MYDLRLFCGNADLGWRQVGAYNNHMSGRHVVVNVAAEARADQGAVQSLTVPVEVAIRRCRYSDLPMLEWYEEGGRDQDRSRSHDRDIILATFEGQAHGESVMLVAQANGVVCGQAWIDLTRLSLDGTGVIWAIHVVPCLRNVGIGTSLIAAAEEILRDRCFTHAELSVEKTNTNAVRLYERLGYRLIQTTACADGNVTSDPVPILVPASQWLMRKPL